MMAHLGEGTQPDASLIRRSLDDPDQFTSIVERHAEAIHRYFSKRSPHSAVDDLVSETFMAAFRSRQHYDFSYLEARPWLFGIATNVLRHFRRSEGRRIARLSSWRVQESEQDRTEEVESSVLADTEANRMRSALEQIDERYRDVLVLVAGPGLTYEEVARALGIPIGTVRSRMSRGRSQLRELLDLGGQYEDEGGPTGNISTAEGLLE